MHEPGVPTFGVAQEMPRAVAVELRRLLGELWQVAHGRAPLGLKPDLLDHQRYFDPVATGRRLRSALADIAPVELPTAFPEPLVIRIDSVRALITPEGRAAIELLDAALGDSNSTVHIDGELAQRLERELLGLYRGWSMKRLTQVIDYLAGSGEKLRIPAIGATLTLLVNRSDSPDRPIHRFAPDENRAAQIKVDEAFFRAAGAFAREVPVARRRSSTERDATAQKERLISGWTLHEVIRRLPGALVIDAEKVHVVPGHVDEVLDFIAQELKRRKNVDRTTVEAAFDALVREFRQQAPALAGFGMLYERPGDTARLRELLLDRFDAA